MYVAADSATSSARISSLRRSNASAMRFSTRYRSCGVLRGHGPSSNAFFAAAIARCRSSTPASGALPIVSSVAGFGTSYVRPLAAGVHFPSMNICGAPTIRSLLRVL
jgi:hypothetical protein